MNSPKTSFVSGRLKAITYALKGMWLLITTEDSIKVQLAIALVMTGVGFYVELSATEWMFQWVVIGLVLVAEALNTAIEEIANFIHPEYHEKIGLIKDIAAGGPAFAALISLIVAAVIYIPKLIAFFN